MKTIPCIDLEVLQQLERLLLKSDCDVWKMGNMVCEECSKPGYYADLGAKKIGHVNDCPYIKNTKECREFLIEQRRLHEGIFK